MKHAEVVESIMQKLVIARDADVGELLAARGFYKLENLSARNNARKILKYLTELGRLEEGGDNGSGGFFKIKGGTKSNFGEHSRHLTKALVKILKVFPDSNVAREKMISEVSIIPDAVVELVDANRRRIFVLEICLNEFESFTTQKADIWAHWSGALNYLSALVGYRVPFFELVAYPESPIKEVIGFDEFWQEAQQQ